MGSFFKALKKGVEAARDSLRPGTYAVCGNPLVCPACRNKVFVEKGVLLNTSRMMLLDMGWADKSATALVCTSCGYIFWFAKRPDQTGTADGGK